MSNFDLFSLVNLHVNIGCFHTWLDCLVWTWVRLLPPAPAGLRSYYFIWVRTVVRLRHQASSCLPRCLVMTPREKAAKCKRLLSALLYIYVFKPIVLFTKLQCIKHLRLSYECTANALKNAEGEHKWNLQLSACSASGKWVKHTQTHIFIK